MKRTLLLALMSNISRKLKEYPKTGGRAYARPPVFGLRSVFRFLLIPCLCAACAPQLTAVVPAATASLEPTSTLAADTPTSSPIPPEPTATSTALSTTRISPADGMTQLYVPAGTVNMGAFDIFAEDDEKPGHAVQIDAFWIDQVEVTNGMYALCVQAGVCTPPMKVSFGNRTNYFGSQEFRDYPVVYVTWLDAKTYCEWTGRRLPTEAEWERAARGDDMRTYPWGGEPPNSLLANANNALGDTSRVGSYAAGASPFGALDMAGNVWEWVADFYNPNYYAVSPAANPTGPEAQPSRFMRVIRGGSYQDGQRDLRTSNRGYELGPDLNALPGSAAYLGHSSVKIGFRCGAGD